MTEIALHQPQTALAEQMDFARAVSEGSLLPDSYRNKPANVLIAVGLGTSMGLSPAESLYRIDVIQGKPTASAELIAANVRKAGHKLRVRIDEQAVSATATIVRADDPDFPFEVTRDRAWAQSMGLLNKDNYKKQPATMLSWRAITAVARLACPEALYGVAYTSDEMYDAPRSESGAPASGGLAAALAPQDVDTDTGEIHDAEIVEEPADAITPQQLKKLQVVLRETGVTDRDEALAYYARVTGREVESSKALTRGEAGQVLDDLERAAKGEPNLLDQADTELPIGGDQ